MRSEKKHPVTGAEDTALKAYLVTMQGEIDVFSFQVLREFFQSWKEDRSEPNLLVDLSLVQYMGSSGWALLFSQNHVAKRREGRVIIFGLNPRLERSLTLISGNREILKTAANKEEAAKLLNEGDAPAAA